MFSLLLRPKLPMTLWPRLTTLAALAICRAVESMLPLRPAIKWPNDVYAGSRKVGGLLAETFTGPEGAFLVLGIGLNVNAQTFAAELAGSATSLLQQMPASVQWIQREELAVLILLELHKWMGCWGDGYGAVLDEVRQRSLLLNRQIEATVDGKRVGGRATGLNEEGHLIVELGDGSQIEWSSAVEVRLA
jgi:BirA family transcriptional regulator, biotin operon repressor / biotin---[acetyl-CoA-carboxylase] ligase